MYLGVIEVLLGCRYENYDEDHVHKSRVAERVVSLLAGRSHPAADRSSTGQLTFLGWSNVDSGRQDLPQDLLSITFEISVVIDPA